MLVLDSRTGSANGAFGWYERQDRITIKIAEAKRKWRGIAVKSVFDTRANLQTRYSYDRQGYTTAVAAHR